MRAWPAAGGHNHGEEEKEAKAKSCSPEGGWEVTGEGSCARRCFCRGGSKHQCSVRALPYLLQCQKHARMRSPLWVLMQKFTLIMFDTLWVMQRAERGAPILVAVSMLQSM